MKVLKLMLKHCRGSTRALTWPVLSLLLKRHGVAMTKNDFQIHVIKWSRACCAFIGSSDLFGYFLIATEKDKAVMAEFYRRRIKKEQQNLRTLYAS